MPASVSATTPGVPRVDLVVPVYNEQDDLPHCVEQLSAALAGDPSFEARIVIVDNGSTDRSWAVAEGLRQAYHGVATRRLLARGRGHALSVAWSESLADIVAYTDADLSSDLSALPPMIQAIHTGAADIAIGSRLVRSASVRRSLRREFLSRGYNLLLRTALQASFHDAQCGFKALRREVALELLPLVRDGGWFFDSELLVLAQWSGFRILEVPVSWVEDPDSRVRLFPTIRDDLGGIIRLARTPAEERPRLQAGGSRSVSEPVVVGEGMVAGRGPSPSR